MEARNNRPASNDWRDNLDNLFLEKNSGSNGYYAEQNERSRPKVYDNEGDRLADNGAFVIELYDGKNYAFNIIDREFYYTNRKSTHNRDDLGGLLADTRLYTVYGNNESANFTHVVYEGKAIYANREVQEPGKYDQLNIVASSDVKDNILDIQKDNSFSYAIAKQGTETATVLRYIDGLSYSDIQKYGQKSMSSTVQGVAYSEVGSVSGASIAKALTPRYAGPYMRGALKTIGKESGGHFANTGILLHSVYDNVRTFENHPDLLKKANDLDVEAFYVGEAVAIGETVATVSTAGEYAVTGKAIGGITNFVENTRVEKKKDKLNKEKEEREKGVQ